MMISGVRFEIVKMLPGTSSIKFHKRMHYWRRFSVQSENR